MRCVNTFSIMIDTQIEPFILLFLPVRTTEDWLNKYSTGSLISSDVLVSTKNIENIWVILI